MNIGRLTKTSLHQNFLQNCRKHVLSLDEANRTGHVWELWCAAVLEHATQRVTPAAQSRPGFDLSLTVGSESIRISCKALNPSDVERKFRATCEMIYTLLGHYLRPGTAAAIVVDLKDTGANGHDPVQLAQRITNAVSMGFSESRADDATIHVAPYRLSKAWWPGKASFHLTIAQSHAKNEQVRFRSKLDDALRNFAMHSAPLPDKTAAAIFVKVPPPVSMSQAIAETKGALNTLDAPISAVFLNRTQLFWSPTGGPPQLGHEYERVDSHARQRLPELLIELPIGIAIGEPSRFVRIGSSQVSSDTSYFFSRARRFHYVAAKGNSTSLQVEPLSTDDVTYISHPAGKEMHLSAAAFPNWTLIL